MQIYKFLRFNLKNIFVIILYCIFLVYSSPVHSGNSSNVTYQAKFKLKYKFGTYSGKYKNIYVIWAENSAKKFYYPIYVCKRLLNGSLTGTALPYWKLNKYPKMNRTDVDAVTGATKGLQDFSFSFGIPVDAPRQFTIYFETDVSFNENDWFADQPAILYKADIDLNKIQNEYKLKFVGWTQDEIAVSGGSSKNKISGVRPVPGALQSNTRSITNKKDTASKSDAFSGVDSRSQTNLVDSIIVIPEK